MSVNALWRPVFMKKNSPEMSALILLAFTWFFFCVSSPQAISPVPEKTYPIMPMPLTWGWFLCNSSCFQICRIDLLCQLLSWQYILNPEGIEDIHFWNNRDMFINTSHAVVYNCKEKIGKERHENMHLGLLWSPVVYWKCNIHSSGHLIFQHITQF